MPRLGLASELVHHGLVSVSSSEGLGLDSAWIVNASVSAARSRASRSRSRLGLD